MAFVAMWMVMSGRLRDGLAKAITECTCLRPTGRSWARSICRKCARIYALAAPRKTGCSSLRANRSTRSTSGPRAPSSPERVYWFGRRLESLRDNAKRNDAGYVVTFFLESQGRAGMAKLADAADLKSAGPKGLWGFDSPSRHQANPLATPARDYSYSE